LTSSEGQAFGPDCWGSLRLLWPLIKRIIMDPSVPRESQINLKYITFCVDSALRSDM
jgi:hypothetical protein